MTRWTKDINLCISSDDSTGSKGNETLDFLEFCPDWEDAILWQKWQEYSKHIHTVQEVRSFYIFRLNVLTFSLDNADTPLVKGPSKPSRHPILVRLGSGGAPVLSSITMNDLNNPYKTKDVQTMLAEYMHAHISMFPSQFEMATSHMTYMS